MLDADRSVHRARARRGVERRCLWAVDAARMEQATRKTPRPSFEAVQCVMPAARVASTAGMAARRAGRNNMHLITAGPATNRSARTRISGRSLPLAGLHVGDTFGPDVMGQR